MRLLINLLGWTPLCLTTGMSVFVLLLLLAFCVLMSCAISDGVTSFSRILIFLFLFLGVSPISMGLGLLGWSLELATLPVLLICYVDKLHQVEIAFLRGNSFFVPCIRVRPGAIYFGMALSCLILGRERCLFRSLGLLVSILIFMASILFASEEPLPLPTVHSRSCY